MHPGLSGQKHTAMHLLHLEVTGAHGQAGLGEGQCSHAQRTVFVNMNSSIESL